jgi:hypothetical protein
MFALKWTKMETKLKNEELILIIPDSNPAPFAPPPCTSAVSVLLFTEQTSPPEPVAFSTSAKFAEGPLATPEDFSSAV